MKQKWELVETGGKLYLFSQHSVEDYDATKHAYFSDPIPGRPLSKSDCIRIAAHLLQHATR